MLLSTLNEYLVITFITISIVTLFIYFKLKNNDENFVYIEDDAQYKENLCYVNKNRPYVLDSRTPNNSFLGSTMNCVMQGKPVSWDTPSWDLPISNPENIAYWNQFPSQQLREL